MPRAHLYLFSDGCPSDWLQAGNDDAWHTIVNFVFQPHPQLTSLIDQGKGHEDVLLLDPLYMEIVDQLELGLPSRRLRKWGARAGKKGSFCKAFIKLQSRYKLIVSACSFQEKVLRASKAGLLVAYNSAIGGAEGRGIGFEEFVDKKGRLQMKHSFANFCGFHEILASESKMLVLMLMAWLAADQYKFFYDDMIENARYGVDGLGMTVISDSLSGDNDEVGRVSEQNLRRLIDPNGDEIPLVLTRSRFSDNFSADLIVDNLAGWFNAAMGDPRSEYGNYARELASTGSLVGWHILQPSEERMECSSAVDYLCHAQGSL